MPLSVPDYSSWLKSRKAKPFKSNTSFFNIPVFNENVPNFDSNTLVSIIATQFNYQATQHFVIKTLPAKPSNPTFCPVIKYTLPNNVVTRYKLWDNVGEGVIPANLYNGEKIFKNFTLEIWTIPVSDPVTNPLLNIVNVNVLPIGISILSYVTDLAKKDTPVEDCIGAECNDLANINSLLPVLQNQEFWLRSDVGVDQNLGTVNSWADSSAKGRNFTIPGGSAAPSYSLSDAGIANKPTVNFDLNKRLKNLVGAAYTANHIFLVLKQSAWTLNRELLETGSLVFKQNDVTPKLDALIAAIDLRNSTAVLNSWFVMEIIWEPDDVNLNTTISIGISPFYISNPFVTQFLAGTLTRDFTDNVIIGDANFKIAELIGYTEKVVNALQVRQYLGYKYNGGLSLPLVFQACTTGNLN